MPTLAIGAALGAVLAYFLDPQNGKRRRHMTRDRTLALVRKRGRRAARGVAAEAYGVSQKLTHFREQPKEFDDVTLARKVETELFRPADAPKGKINVNVVDGVVQLRGEVAGPELIEELVEKATRIQGVQAVENLLHLSGKQT